MLANLAVGHAPAMASPPSVTLVVLATKLVRISRKHRFNHHSPSLQAQPVWHNDFHASAKMPKLRFSVLCKFRRLSI
jgi:hypothetical protein